MQAINIMYHYTLHSYNTCPIRESNSGSMAIEEHNYAVVVNVCYLFTFAMFWNLVIHYSTGILNHSTGSSRGIGP